MSLNEPGQTEETKIAIHVRQTMSWQSEKRLNNLDFFPNGLEKVMSISPGRVPFGESYSKIVGCIRRYNLPRPVDCVRISFSGRHQSGKSVPQNLRGLPDRGEYDWFPRKKEPTPADTVLLNCSPAAWQAAMTPSSCSKFAARHIERRWCRRCVHARNKRRTRGNCLAGT